MRRLDNGLRCAKEPSHAGACQGHKLIAGGRSTGAYDNGGWYTVERLGMGGLRAEILCVSVHRAKALAYLKNLR
jgi:hypothetical protein